MSNELMLQSIKELAEVIRKADGVVVGIGSGMSGAAGYNHYHWTSAMEEYLEDFKEYYNFSSPFAGFYHCYPSYETQWAYYTKYMYSMWKLPTGQPYLDLKSVLRDKDYFVLTTNIDMQCERVFPEERLCLYQGSMGYLQCSQPCHDKIYKSEDIIERLNNALTGVTLPKEFVPRCPECGRIMVPWVRDDTFLEGSYREEGIERYHNFLSGYLEKQVDKSLLFLELGVGEMSLSIIKLPFWDMTHKNPQTFYACLNLQQSSAPEHLKGRSLYVAGDLAVTLSKLKEEM